MAANPSSKEDIMQIIDLDALENALDANMALVQSVKADPKIGARKGVALALALANLYEALGIATYAMSHEPDPRYLSVCPEGYDTVLGYLAKHFPERLEVMDEDAEATQRDGYWLRWRCKERGIARVKVDAPTILREQGIEMVNAYPVELLGERFK